MDPSRFDTVARELSRARSRRGALATLVGATLGLLGLAETEAKHKKKHKKKKLSPPASPPPLSCPNGQKPCDGGCIPTSQCCADNECSSAGLPRCCGGSFVPPTPCCRAAHCTGGKTCVQGLCRRPADKPKDCNGGCPQCCVKGDCTPSIRTDDGTPECSTAGVCVCARPGTRSCPDGSCGTCCSAAECTAIGEGCIKPVPSEPAGCHCTQTEAYCTAQGKT